MKRTKAAAARKGLGTAVDEDAIREMETADLLKALAMIRAAVDTIERHTRERDREIAELQRRLRA